ncbi:MAG: DUF72 domain-containing protein [Sphaerochaetaceae bacterium]|jgi:uncharacterized protein YecE (DUF72 family)
MSRIIFGTCSWKYPSWKGLVYSSDLKPMEYLQEYAQHYSMVEVDQWFWSLGESSFALPEKEVVTTYNNQTPESFRFTIKCPNALTLPFTPKQHINTSFLDEKVYSQFLASLEPIHNKIGLLMLQFGYLNKQMIENQKAFEVRLSTFFDAIDSSFPLGIEMRNPKWINGQWFEFLSLHNIAPVFIQGYWLDDIVQTIRRYEHLLPQTISIRLHGEDRKGIEQEAQNRWDTLIWPKNRELAQVAQLLTHLSESGRTVYVQVNNHYEGSAPQTIQRIQQLM